MKSLRAFLRLIRLPNLIIIALTQYAIRYGLMFPMLYESGFSLQMSEGLFFLLVLTTVMIAAAGYIINDYFDTKIDFINKPKKVIVGKTIKRRIAMGAHIVINAIALLFALYLAFYLKTWWLCLIQIASILMLWNYSINFKRRLLIGNLIIAALTALVPLSAGLYEFVELKNHLTTQLQNYIIQFPNENPIFAALYFKSVLKTISIWIIGYALFAFLLTLIREIIKDIEDYEGDLEQNCKTLPILYGKNVANHIAVGISIFTFLTVAFVQYMQYIAQEWLSFGYFALFVQIPIILLIIRLLKAKKKNEYAWASRLTKLIMLFGILYTSIIYLQEFYLNA